MHSTQDQRLREHVPRLSERTISVLLEKLYKKHTKEVGGVQLKVRGLASGENFCLAMTIDVLTNFKLRSHLIYKG